MEELLANLTLEETFTLSNVFREVSDIQTEMIDVLKEKQKTQNETIELLQNNIQIVADINSQNNAIIDMLKTQLSNSREIEKLETMLEGTDLAPASDEINPGLEKNADETKETSRSTKFDTRNTDN